MEIYQCLLLVLASLCLVIQVNGAAGGGRKVLFSSTKIIGDIISDLWPSSKPVVGICESRVQIFGYPCEEHMVTTKDGYILNIQRIPGGSSSSPLKVNKVPVLLQHGILMDGVAWLLDSQNQSLGYILADNGYDVWISNARGTVHSQGHTTLSSNEPAYWDWSWDELAAYDLPSMVGYIYEHTGQQKVHYVGHSLGTLMILASLCNQTMMNMLRSAALLSPIAYLDQISSTLIRAAATMYLGEGIYNLGFSQFNPNGRQAQILLQQVCIETDMNCYDMLRAITGKNCCLNSSSLQVFLDHEPQPTSTKNLVHLAQMLRRGTITKFDYNIEVMNMVRYGLATPPAYNMPSIPVGFPLFMSYGNEDVLSDVGDVKHLLELLKSHNGTDNLMVQFMEDYAHMDFIMAYNAKQLVYEPLMDFFKVH